MRIGPVPNLPGLGVVLVGQQPLLGSGGQAGLEFVPLPARRGLGPERPEARLNRSADDTAEKTRGISHRPHGTDMLAATASEFSWARWSSISLAWSRRDTRNAGHSRPKPLAIEH